MTSAATSKTALEQLPAKTCPSIFNETGICVQRQVEF
jgi:hypothetical protein